MTRATDNTTRRWLRGGRRAFTLVELMVAMLIAAVVMYGVYMLYERSSSAFRVQNQLTGMQQQLRFGVEQLKRDIDRAGFLATPNSAVDGDVCDTSSAAQPLHGVIVNPDFAAGWDTVHLGSTGNPNVTPTSVTMFGDFWSQGPFRVHSVSGNQVVLDGSFYYDRDGDGDIDFPDDTDGDGIPDAPGLPTLNDWFRRGRLVRFVNQSGIELYRRVLNVVPNAGGPPGANWPVIVLDQAIPVVYTGDGCGVLGVGTGALLNPVGYVRYRIAPDARSDAPADKYDLIREEMDPDDPVNQIVPRSQLTIAEYAVDLQFYDFIFDERPINGPQPVLTRVTANTEYPRVEDVVAVGGGGRLGTDNNAVPHRLRALTFKLSVRTPDEDPNIDFRPRPDTSSRLTSFEVDPNSRGGARVRSLSGRVVLNNFVTRNLLR